jgi:hypothetical protein
MAKAKIVLWGLLVALALLGAGWFWGAAGRWDAQASLGESELRLRLAEARGALARARVDLFELNYGQASRDLDQAKGALDDAARRLEQTRQADAAGAVREAIARTVEAQRLAASVNTTANERAAEALKALDRATGMPPTK